MRWAAGMLHQAYRDARDDWMSRDVRFPLAALGYGARADMSWYLEGPSEVTVSDLEELCTWLRGCEYRIADDARAPGRVWRHPSEFERTRAGDCMDFALWAWRKLYELGQRPELMVGERWRDGKRRQHAWVVFGDAGERRLMEPAHDDGEMMVRDLDSVRKEYVPWASVTDDRHVRLYGGYAAAIRRLGRGA